MKSSNMKEIVFSYFSDSATPLQKEQIEQWLTVKENEEQYYEWLLEWETKMPEYLPNVDEKLHLFKRFMQENPHKNFTTNATIHLEQDNPFFKNSVQKLIQKRIALVASLLIVLGTISFYKIVYYKTYKTSVGETKYILLNDKSTIVLNANSMLKVPRFNFFNKNREVFLDGGAQFSVYHTLQNEKFVVKTNNNFEIEVLGTEFSVLSNNLKSRVILNKGKVQVNYTDKIKTLTHLMKPGEMVTMEKHNKIEVVENAKVIKFDLKEKRIVFQNTRLSEVASMLEETYGVKVIFSNQELANRKLMGTFRAENLNDFLDLIKEVFNVEIEKKGDNMFYFNTISK